MPESDDDGRGGPIGNNHAAGNPGGGAPDGNQNATKHGLYADNSKLYQHFNETQREITHVLIESFEERISIPSTPGVEKMLFDLAVDMVKKDLANNYLVERAEADDVENPLIERGIAGVGESGPYYEERPNRIHNEISRLSKDNRTTMDKLGLLPGSNESGGDTYVAEINGNLITEREAERIREAFWESTKAAHRDDGDDDEDGGGAPLPA